MMDLYIGGNSHSVQGERYDLAGLHGIVWIAKPGAIELLSRPQLVKL